MFVDGHLDLALNEVALGRDLTRSVEAIRADERRSSQEVMVTLPELRAGGVGLAVATLFTAPRTLWRPESAPPLTQRQLALTYATPDEAERLALDQLAVYRRWEDEGHVRVVRTRGDLDRHAGAWSVGDQTLGLVLSLEGADPIRQPAELGRWVGRGVRLVGPAWQRTRYAGGTHQPGPLTALGRDLVAAMREAGVPVDLSHLAEEATRDVLALDAGPVFASHSNARALTPGDRHLSDETLGEIGARDGIVGVVLGNEFVKAGVQRGDPKESVTLADVRAQAEHVAALVGWERVGVGSDFDGGFGLQETPLELTRAADFHKLGAAAPPEARDGLLGGNWLRFLRRVLPE